jgi:glutathione S-transferase
MKNGVGPRTLVMFHPITTPAIITDECQNFSEQLATTSGPTFLPDGQLSTVDLTLFPWAYRYYVLEHYRGPDYAIPAATTTRQKSLDKYHEWFLHMMGLDSVRRTLPDRDRYLDHIRKYADGTARSKVANAVRRGVVGT